MKLRATTARTRFSDNLRRYMALRDITQTDIVERLGVSSATASAWVNGAKFPRVDAMQALADLLEVSMTDLMKDMGEEQPENDEFTALRERLRRQPGMRILFEASKGATEQDLIDAAHLIEGFKKRREGSE